MKLEAHLIKTGPLFDGTAIAAVPEMQKEAARRTAELGAALVRQQEHRVFKKETPYYRPRNVAQEQPYGYRIWDSNVIYGNWLEGTSRRNARSRFKGYWTYRKMKTEVEKLAGTVAQNVADEYVREMNG